MINEEHLHELFDLIYFIGGLSGLFLGASFLRFIEIFEMINGVILHLIEDGLIKLLVKNLFIIKIRHFFLFLFQT